MDTGNLLKLYTAGQRDFSQITLNVAKLCDVKLPFIVLAKAKLRDADLSRANLAGADLTQINLQNAKLIGTNLIGAELFQANLQGANLSRALVSGANLTGANLGQSILSEATLSGAELSMANLRSANLKNANLRDANLRSANLRDAILTGADLEGADLTGAVLPNGKRVLAETVPKSSSVQENLEIAATNGVESGAIAHQSFQANNAFIDLDLQLGVQQVPAPDSIRASAVDSEITAFQDKTVVQSIVQSNVELSESERAGETAKIIKMSIARRRGHHQFRNRLLELYERRCAITGCDAEPVLEAAYIYPQAGLAHPDLSNGLLLRADLHTLFDLNLLMIDPQTMTVLIAPELCQTSYRKLAGRALRLPKNPTGYPSIERLKHRLEQCIWSI